MKAVRVHLIIWMTLGHNIILSTRKKVYCKRAEFDSNYNVTCGKYRLQPADIPMSCLNPEHVY